MDVSSPPDPELARIDAEYTALCTQLGHVHWRLRKAELDIAAQSGERDRLEAKIERLEAAKASRLAILRAGAQPPEEVPL